MNTPNFIKALFLTVIISGILSFNIKAADRDYYQIKIYRLDSETQEKLTDTYLEQAYLPALHRAGISDVGVFKPIEADTAAGNIIIVLIPFKSLEQLEKLPQILEKDKKYLSDGKPYIEATYDKPPYRKFESTLLKAFTVMPHLSVPAHPTPPSERIYELRSYQGPTELMYQRKVEMFNEGGEVEIFNKLGFNAVFFGEVISGSEMPNLMYMTTFSDMESHDQHWDAFRNHPDWAKLKEVEKYKNTVSNSIKYLLHPTDYSDI